MYDPAQKRLFELDEDLVRRIEQFATLPYKKSPFRRRNWGHPLHNVCSYPSKLKPAIAHTLVTYFSRIGQTILDPFSGSATIPLEACLNGRVGIGSDLSPLAYHITRAKVTPPTINEVKTRIELLDKYLKSCDLENTIFTFLDLEIQDFYHTDTLAEILKARKFLFENEPDDVSSFLIANIAHILHGNRPYALSRRSHNIIPIPPKGEFVYKSLIKSLTEKVLRILAQGIPHSFVKGRAYQNSVLELHVPDDSIDLIITSPPFLGTTQFLRQNRLRLWFCGWNYEEQKNMKEQFLEESKQTGNYSKVFKEFDRVLKDRALCIIHLGVVNGRNMASELIPVAEDAGFKAIRTVYEDTRKLESHGRTDRGSTSEHQFLFLSK